MGPGGVVTFRVTNVFDVLPGHVVEVHVHGALELVCADDDIALELQDPGRGGYHALCAGTITGILEVSPAADGRRYKVHCTQLRLLQ